MAAPALFDPLTPAALHDPYPQFDRIRETAPVTWHPALGAWLVSQHAECQEVLRDHTRFARDPRRVGGEIGADLDNIQVQDPPDQARLRRSIMRALHAQDLDRICEEAGRAARRALLGRGGGPPFDVMAEIAAPAAMKIINTTLGVDHYTAAGYLPLFTALTRAMDSGLDPERLADGVAAGAELRRVVADWVRDGEPAAMIAAALDGDTLAREEELQLISSLAGVYNAGFSTTYAMTGALTALAVRRPEVLDAFRALDGSEARSRAAHELLRFLSPAQATSRYAAVDTTLRGNPIAAGDVVITLLAAANRDPRVFADPGTIDLGRRHNPHLAFAWGPHVCLGSALALSWIEVYTEVLLDLAPRLSLTGEARFLDSATLRATAHLPVRVSTPSHPASPESASC
ncbi:cytochrome P450 [Cellulomonas triticagri]|uniref:Cytochrome P450 n=1 Tax=Cellulomonas triticagri TaxID=2483352 RepID=A0A3M2JPR0_9CELL|nr:cytochrome P450 [Cellulomonas triticagri]RMI14346.1 cytochrome P450 [Cellulomonas triticagri]